jgi:tetrahydromethanopterin S-methyltransferase subunit G
MNARFEAVQSRFDSLDKRVDNLDGDVSALTRHLWGRPEAG